MKDKKENILKPGLTGTLSFVVEKQHTARHVGSGTRDVLATPALVAFLEAAAQEAVNACLEENYQTVGTHLALSHSAATPVGMRVTVSAELMEVNKRMLAFQLNAHDEMEEIATGTHTRTLALASSLDRMLQKKAKKQKK